MRLKIAICDDNIEFLNELTSILTRYQFYRNIDFVISPFTDGNDLIDAYKNNETFDIILLDIEMKKTNGIDVAKIIKGEYSKTVYLVFITSYSEYMLESFDAHPFYFINKPINDDKIFLLFNNIIEDFETNNIYRFFIETDLGSESIDIRDIYSVETSPSRRNYCTIKMNNRELECRSLMNDWTNYLASYGFIHVHRCYLVNLRHIHFVHKDEVVMSNGNRIPLSKTGRKLISTKYFK